MAKTNRPSGKPKPKPRRPVAKAVAGGRSPALIATFVAVGVLAAAIIGYAIYAGTRGGGPSPTISGLVDYRSSDPKMLTRNHVRGTVAYPVSPPVGGDHNPVWQDCMGDVYPAAIANENAVHSLEHGAVWITYRPDLPADQIETLAGKVRGTPYLFMSPFPGLDRPISLQAWGLQPKVDTATDPRIEEFIRQFRITAAPERGASCSNGVTATGTTPHHAPGG
ncbi:DUF3105 domain-containing protein [Micromonospora sp. NPDC005806]|uniref:DUF3105 domain-containing protein n=1 Tax=Micromonospora sp. NPDC005806 TaxID=3364234 RepID=UPI0036CA0874